MRLIAITAAAGLLGGAAFADVVKPGDVQYGEYGAVEASLSGTAGDAENGAMVIASKSKGNCVACHQISSIDAPFQGEVGPPLDGVGGYRTAAELRGIVANAKKTFEGSVMPAFYKTSGFIRPGDGYTGKAANEEDLEPILSAQEIEDVVAYLLTLQGS